MARADVGWSLERRLLGGLSAVLALLAFGLFFVIAGYAQHAADDAHDRLLFASALSIADAVQLNGGRIAVDLPYASLAILGTSRRDRVFYSIVAPDGSPLTGYPDLAAGLPLAHSDEPRFTNIAYLDAAPRAAVLGRFVAGVGGGWVTIVVAQTRIERTALARGILASAFGSVLAMLVIATVLIWYGVRRALGPLGQLERLIRAREPTDLSPIEAPAPVEVRALLTALNSFMGRLHASLRHMRSFVADATHQIRNPLAGLRAQAELAAEEEDSALLRAHVEKICRSAAVASQLTNQLLSHAMVTYRHELPRRERVDLAALARQAARRAEAGAEGAVVRVEVEELEAPALVSGDPVTLGEAVANLLDNALKYAGAGGPIEVRLARPAGSPTVRLEVVDRGPGIPDAEKGCVVERFGRGNAAGDVVGSGLGLTIVKEVADAHGAAFSLRDHPGGGLVVRLEFPVPGPDREAGSRLGKVACLSLAMAAALADLGPTTAAESIIYPGPASGRERLRIHAATDRTAMEPLLADFQATHPTTTVEYVDFNTNELYASVTESPTGTVPDLVISSAMDLQVKLVNDGWTQPHVSEATRRLPAWANWRDEAFGFTYEPAVIVYRRGRLGGSQAPRTHLDLIRLLQERPDRFRTRVATYDPGESGVGYLFATQDSVLSNQFWQLAAALGSLQARLYPASAEMLDALERDDVDVAYNVLGSYARARRAAGAPIEIVAPEDYTLVMSRVATIPRKAADPALAKAFLDHLLSERGQAVMDGASGLQAITTIRQPGVGGVVEPRDAAASDRPIRLGPALLVFLDDMKRRRFLTSWRAAMNVP